MFSGLLELTSRNATMFAIGEFSKITGLTVKTLRHYHAQGVLAPSYVDEQTGYRYYAESKIETACMIAQLRRLEFSLPDIAEILTVAGDEADILDALERHKDTIHAKVQRYAAIGDSLDQIITKEREAQAAMQNASYEVQEKAIDAVLIAGVRMRGKYSDCGKGFAQIGRRFGRHICGKAMMLHYDAEYKEDDADFEVCMPIRKGTGEGAVAVRRLPGGRCVTLLHKGPYDELGRSYAKILGYVNQKGYEVQTPTREVYIKGPGMIFKGNPKKYLTEIQMMIKQ